jgi:probable rRNA maturation factor
MARMQTVFPRPPAFFRVCNRQKTRRLNLPLARELVARLLEEWASAEMTVGCSEVATKLPGTRKFSGFLPKAATTIERPCGKEEPGPGGELGIYFVNAAEMTRLNEQFLGHAGSTDVITFDYEEEEGCRGEIFVCVDEAVASAPRFRGTWQKELARYVVHGMLHLRGYEDGRPAARRAMKKEENRLLKALSRRLDWCKLEKVNHAARRK